MAPSCCLVVSIQSTLKHPKWTSTPKIMAMVQNCSKRNSTLLKLSIFYHPIRLGFHHFEAHPSITQTAPHSYHTKVLSKGPGGFCNICGTKALTTTTTCSTQLRPKPRDRWEMKGKTMGFSVKKIWRIIWGYHLFSNNHESRNEYLQEFLFFFNNGRSSTEWVTQYVLDSFGGGNFKKDQCISCYLTPFPSLWNQKTYFHQPPLVFWVPHVSFCPPVITEEKLGSAVGCHG